jgi:hypothetical protein
MAALITVDEVQTWLESTKLRLATDDALAEESPASTIVLAKLASVFDVSGWTTAVATPKLVRKIISMLVAAWRYNALYSETDAEHGNPYADKLEKLAWSLLDGIILGQLVITEILDEGPAIEGIIDFYPTDASTAVDDEDNAGIAFSMGRIF